MQIKAFKTLNMNETTLAKKKRVVDGDDDGDIDITPGKEIETEKDDQPDEADKEKQFIVDVKEVRPPGPAKPKTPGAKAKAKAPIEPSNIKTRAATRSELNKPDTTKNLNQTTKEENHFGTHSVTTNFVTRTKLDVQDVDISQNIISEGLLYNRSHPEFFQWADEHCFVMSTVTGPAAERPGRMVGIQTLFDRWVHVPIAPAAPIVPIPPTLVWNDPIKLDTMDINLLSELVVGTTPKPRPIQEGLMHLMGCNNIMATALAPSLLENLTRHDTSSIWGKAFVTYSVLSDFADRVVVAHRPYRYVPPAVDPLILVNITPADGGLNDNVALFNNGIATGALVLHRRDLSHPDIYALRIMSIGPQCLGSLLANEERGVVAANDHVLFTVNTPQINWVIVQEGAEALPAQVVITAAQFLASILKIATMCASNDEVVRGFIKACALSYGRMLDGNRRFTTSTLEMGRFSWNRPWGHNPLWRFLNREPARKNTVHFNRDALALRSMTYNEVTRIMTLIAAIISFSASATFHHLNLSGVALNAQGGAVLAGNVASRTIITQLLQQNDSRSQTMYDLMCGFPAQVTKMVVNRSCFWGSRWSDNMTSFVAADWHANASWQGNWQWFIPYLSNPLSVSSLLTSYSHLWGISQPPVSYNFHGEMRSEGPVIEQGWYTFRGTDEYHTALTKGKPYVYVPYGALAINAALQDLQIAALWDIGYQSWTVLGGHAEKGNNIVVADRMPQYLPQIRMINLGTLVSYDWASRSLLAPFVLAEDMGANWNTLKRRETALSDNAGVVPEGGVPAIETDMANFNLGDLISGSFTGMYDADLAAAEKSVGDEGN